MSKYSFDGRDAGVLGLQGFWQRYSGASFLNKIKNLPYELRCAWSRAWKGYDYNDICGLDNRFVERMSVVLPEFKHRNVGLFGELDEEQTDAVLDRLIYLIKKMDEDVCAAEIGGLYDKSGKFSMDRLKQAHELQDSSKNEFFDLFKEYFWCLWY